MSDEERDAIEREMEQHAAEEAAQAEAEAEAEADRAMSAEGKVICVRAKSGKCKMNNCTHFSEHKKIITDGILCTETSLCLSDGGCWIKCVPVSGEEACRCAVPELMEREAKP